MPNLSISQLTAGGAVSGTDIFPDVQTAGVGPVKVTATQLKTFMSASPSFTGNLTLNGATSGTVTLGVPAIAGTTTFTLPGTNGTNGFILTTNGSGVTSWTNPTALGIDLDVGSTAITGGTTGRVLYNNAGVLGEYAITGTGSVVLGTSPTFTTSALFPAGTVGAPGISVSGDTDTGIYFPAANTIGFVEGGVESMRINSSGYVGIAITNPATLLDMFSGTLGAAGKARIGDFRTSSGNGFTIPAFEALGNRDDGNTTFEGRIGLAVRRSDGTALQSAALLGMVAFGGQVGTSTSYSAADLLYSASIKGVAEGAFTSSTAMPTAITFSTGSSGDDLTTANRAYGTERMRIDASGKIGIGTTSPNSLLTVYQTSDGEIARFQRGGGSNIPILAISLTESTKDVILNATGATPPNLEFQIGGSEKARIDSSGNVGIGTNSPGFRLDVNGTIRGRGDYYFGFVNGSQAGVWWSQSNYAAPSFQGLTSAGNVGDISMQLGGGNLLVGTTSALARLASSASSGAIFAVDASSTNDALVNFTSAGTTKTQMYWQNANNRFYVAVGSGGVYLASAGTSWTSASDERVKDIIEPIENAISKVASLRTVIGKYKADKTNKRRAFLIAQDVQSALPEAVDSTNADELGLQYTDIIPLALAAIKELAAKVSALEAKQ